MINVDFIQEIYFTVRQNKLRTFLTAFGVFWGILMLILLLGSGAGLQHGVEKSYGADARNAVTVIARRIGQPYKGTPQGKKVQFYESDIAAIKANIPGVEFISGENYTGSRWNREVYITHKNRSVRFGVYGVTEEYFEIKRYQDYVAGRRLNRIDNDEARKVVVIGTAIADALFQTREQAIGEYIVINGVSLKVVGVFFDKGWNGRMSERLYIPFGTFQNTFGEHGIIDLIAVTPEEGIDPFRFEEQIVSLLKRRHTISPNDEKAIFVWSNARQAYQFNQLFTAISAFVWFVGIGTLMAGIVGISNIMIITVKDRTREIGIRKALGATPASITLMILSESVIITTIAGYLGLVLGVFFLESANQAIVSSGAQLPYFERPEVDFSTAITALVLLVSAGALAGLAPALRAAQILPIEAMREE
ncbi:ABC transporter permease [Teredinibacter sp. KSP-S5-2]|nr:ABC transporter permease [Teredinibacter sp. KSP-S5-2]